jgi:Tfp pilus assembly protein PilE
MLTCTKCGNTIEEGHRFCRVCGTSFDPSSPRSPESASQADTTRKDLTLFIGKNADKYLYRFRNFDRNGQDSFAVTWHWPAFLFNFWWALYRKMYGWAVLVLLISCVPYVGLLMMIGFGMSANYFYYRRAKRLVSEIKAGPGTDIDKAAAIARAGGVNNVAVVVAPILIIALMGILAAIAIPQFVMYRLKSYEAKAQQEIMQACSVGAAFFASHPEKTQVEPDDLLYNGLVRTAEVEMLLLDGRKEYFSIKARHVKGKKTYYTDAQCTLRVEEDALPGKPVYQPGQEAVKGDKREYQF